MATPAAELGVALLENDATNDIDHSFKISLGLQQLGIDRQCPDAFAGGGLDRVPDHRCGRRRAGFADPAQSAFTRISTLLTRSRLTLCRSSWSTPCSGAVRPGKTRLILMKHQSRRERPRTMEVAGRSSAILSLARERSHQVA